MPKRLLPLITNHIYHIYNRTIDGRIIFKNEAEYGHALMSFNYYLYSSPTPKLSTFLKFSTHTQSEVLDKLKKKDKKLITPIAFCIMPDHFHFLVIQNENGGISKFAANFQNSYTKYFNTKYKRLGPLLLTRFKAVKIESENQLLHLSRYIHLNPYSSKLVKNTDELVQYPWSSLPEYLYPDKFPNPVCDKTIILQHFKKTGRYKDFILNQAGYQRSLKQIRNAIMEH